MDKQQNLSKAIFSVSRHERINDLRSMVESFGE